MATASFVADLDKGMAIVSELRLAGEHHENAEPVNIGFTEHQLNQPTAGDSRGFAEFGGRIWGLPGTKWSR